MANIHGLGPAKKAEDKKGVEHFASSGHTSSTAVARPVRGAPGAGAGAGAGAGPPLDDIASILGAARQHKDDTTGQDRNIGLITLYANGFIVGDGEFRDIKDPRNANFLKSLKAGDVPRELEAECRREWGADIDAVQVNLVDKSRDTYAPPPAKFSFATSSGQSLGGVGAAKPSPSAASFASAVPREYKNPGTEEKKTTLQLVLHPSKKTRADFYPSTTVLQVFEHVMFLSGLKKFELVAGFPPKPLTDPRVTLKEANLIGASIQQRPVP